jgi:hypothetical protein
MTRIDPLGPAPVIPGASVHPSRAASRAFGCGGCALAFLLAIVLACVVALMAVAKIGAVDVPFLTKAVYHPDEPVRDVEPLAGYSQEDVLRSVAARASVNPVSRTVTATISEQELTTIVAKGMAEAEADGAPKLKDAQFAITEGGIEFSARTASSGDGVPVLVDAVPVVADGALSLEVKRLAIGDFDIPGPVISFVASTIGKHAVQSLQRAIAELGTVTAVDLQEGRMSVTLRPE